MDIRRSVWFCGGEESMIVVWELYAYYLGFLWQLRWSRQYSDSEN